MRPNSNIASVRWTTLALIAICYLPAVHGAPPATESESTNTRETFEGPSGVISEQRDIAETLDAFCVDNRKFHLRPWYDWKAKLKERSGIPSAALRGEIGAAATDPGFAYSDNFGTAFAVLAWQQLFANKRAGIAVGLLDSSAYVDTSYYQTLSRGFLNRSFILNPILAATGIGALGAVTKGMVGKNFWVAGVRLGLTL